MTKDILLLILLLFLSGFFSASETALVSLSPAKVRTLIQQGKKGAKSVGKLKKHPHKLLITILVGNNLVNIAASVYATIVFQQILGNKALGIITGVLTLFVLIFGEIVPKSFAQTYSKKLSRIIAPPLYVFYVLLSPVVWILDLLVKGLLHLSDEQIEKNVTEEELKAFVSIGAEEGAIEKGEQTLIENVLEFNDTRVEEIMVPRVKIHALSGDSTVHEAADFVMKEHHSRMPIYEGTIDNVIGLLTVKDIIQHMHGGKMQELLKDLKLIKPFKIPASKKINRLFHEFQKRRTHLAIVLDEHGGTVGLITLEDILEEIVGEIVDEYDEDEKQELTKVGTMEVQATGKALICDINDALEIHVPCPDHRTISYYITEKLGRFPKQGEIIKGRGYKITVDTMENHVIAEVTIEKTSKKK
jgi:CBS domain containing-hemolysin-like protein